MSSGRPPAGFPGAEAKLSKPIKQSAFERSKAEAEAKRKRDEAETAAVYEEFVKSFDHDEDDDAPGGGVAPQRPRHGFGGPPSGLNTSKRHFAMSSMRKSGPGSLGPVPGSYGAKRSYNDFSKGSRERDFPPNQQEPPGGPKSVSTIFNHVSDDENDIQRDAIERAELKAIAKSQLRLSNMPPGTSPAAIKALIPDTLTVDAVKIEPPAGPSSERKCTNAVVTLSRDSSGGAMDAAVSSLQNRYLGYGYYLSAHRHLSSAVLNPVSAPIPSSSAAQPFGAKQMEQKPGPQKHMGQHGFHRGFAPPSSYSHAGSGTNLADRFYVPVKPPEDIRVVRMIHMIVERVLEDGPEFEALLMSRPEVQHEEKWAWLWDSKSVGGIWYRWRLWELKTGYQANPKKEPYVHLFEDSAPWQVPDPLPFEFVSEFDELVSDPDYDSSDDEEMDRDGNAGEVESPFLNPLEKAKLVHLLARLPTSHSKLRKGDVARVTAFALQHADRGPGEVVDLIISNIGRPFAFTSANPDRNKNLKEAQQATGTEEGTANEGPDTSGGSLIGLYLVSDILSSSSTTVFRHAWRFRGLFERALNDYQVFDFLGTMPEQQGWGRLRAEKWKRSINLVLHLWEGWCVFPTKTQEVFMSTFENPPSPKVEEERSGESPDRSKWKSLKTKSTAADEAPPGQGDGAADVEDDATGEPIEDDDVEGEPITEDDVEGEPILDDDIEGEPISDSDMQSDPMDQDDNGNRDNGAIKDASGEPGQGQTGAADGRVQGQRKRIRAVDMFANSDDSDGSGK
ncbi:FAD dependent oxidoreductase [Hirsutella rhossiliensis]